MGAVQSAMRRRGKLSNESLRAREESPGPQEMGTKPMHAVRSQEDEVSGEGRSKGRNREEQSSNANENEGKQGLQVAEHEDGNQTSSGRVKLKD